MPAKTITKLDEFKNNIIKMEEQFQNVLPAHIEPKKFVRVVVTAVQRTPDLLNLNRQSLFNACMLCATDGLLPDGREAALVKFGHNAQYMPMVAGVMKKVRNSGELGMIDAQVVYENDKYESWIDENGPHFKHVKSINERGKPILTYAYAKTKDGFLYFEEVDESQIAKIEKMSKTSSVWKGAFRDEMRRKSVIRRLAKRLPMSTDVEDVMQRDDNMYDLDKANEEEPKPEKEVVKKSKLEQVVEDTIDVECKEESNEAEGVIDDLKVKTGPEGKNGKPKWTKYGFRIDGKYYTTFDRKVYDQAVKLMDSHSTVKIEFEKAVKDDSTYFNVLKIEENEEYDGDIPL